MKTPRELLLRRHREAKAALDEIRREVLRTLTAADRREVRAAASPGERWLGAAWRELFVACRRYWMGLGLAWCVIMILTVAGGTYGPGRAMAAAPPSEPMIRAMREQQRLRDELLDAAVVEEAPAARHDAAPRPRSEVAVGSANV